MPPKVVDWSKTSDAEKLRNTCNFVGDFTLHIIVANTHFGTQLQIFF
jgi:hypothetical protein